jgi:hypothetical protein
VFSEFVRNLLAFVESLVEKLALGRDFANALAARAERESFERKKSK